MKHLQHNHPNQIFGSASSDDISLPATAEWQLSGTCTENEEHLRGRREPSCSVLPQSVPASARLNSYLTCSDCSNPISWKGQLWGNGRDNLIYSSGSGMSSCASKETPRCVLWKSSLSDTGTGSFLSPWEDTWFYKASVHPHYSTIERTQARSSEFFTVDSGLEPSAPPAWFSIPSTKTRSYTQPRTVALSLPHLFSIVSRLFAAFQALFT